MGRVATVFLSLATSLAHTPNTDVLDGFAEITDEVRGLNVTVGDPPAWAQKPVAISFWRSATKGVLKYPFENNNAAALGADIKYLHTEVVVEGINIANKWPKRKYAIDTIVEYRMKMKNPDALKSSKQSHQVDFGSFVTFDLGLATNKFNDDDIKNYGGFVGIQVNPPDQANWLSYEYSWWFSVVGQCPNLPFTCTSDSVYVDTKACGAGKPTRPQPRCKQDFGRSRCPGKWLPGRPNKEWGGAHGKYLNKHCIKTYRPKGKVLGGLCRKDENTGDPQPFSFDPTGEFDCTYSYSPGIMKDIDELTGIKKEICIDTATMDTKPCSDWNDFHLHCKDTKKYARLFSGGGDVASPYGKCTEYDIASSCRNGCGAPHLNGPSDKYHHCQDLVKQNAYEIGIAFWLGRCDPMANSQRVEKTAAYLGFKDVNELHLTISPSDNKQKCHDPDAGGGGSCKPTPKVGGPYCTRRWGGACWNCFVPGTKKDYPDKTAPPCPFDIFQSGRDYEATPPECSDSDPAKMCCLYRPAGPCHCSPSMPLKECFNPLTTTFDKKGVAASIRAAQLHGTKEFMIFLGRVAGGGKPWYPADKKSYDLLHHYAHWKWYKLWMGGITPTGLIAAKDIMGELKKELGGLDGTQIGDTSNLKMNWSPTEMPTPPSPVIYS